MMCFEVVASRPVPHNRPLDPDQDVVFSFGVSWMSHYERYPEQIHPSLQCGGPQAHHPNM
jgi:hypothetical protein